MATADFQWEPEGLSDEERALIRAYAEVGRPIDDLAYTPDFDKLVQKAGLGSDQEAKHKAFRQLLNLRKRGRLPRLVRHSANE